MLMKKFICSTLLCLLSATVFAADDPQLLQREASVKYPQKGTVALTFDDGPSPIFTPKILNILKQYNIKATFFMVGENAKKYPEMVKLVDASGMAIGNHSFTHPLLTKLNDEQLHKEVETPQTVIYNIIGKKPACLRYPFGASNQHVRDVIRQNNMIPIPMGFNSFDYERPGVQKIVSQVLDHVHSGTVILLHDGYSDHQQTVDALPQIIEGIKNKGLGFSEICVEK